MAHSKPLKVAVITNANAGKGTKREGLGMSVARALTKEKYIFATSKKEDLPAAIARIIRLNPDIVGFAGGDGTLQVSSSMWLNMLRQMAPDRPIPMVANLPLGTMRIVATNLGLTKMDPLSLAKHFRAKLDRGEVPDVMRIFMLNVNDGTYCALYAGGIATEILNNYNSRKKKGAIGAIGVIHDAIFDEITSALTFTQPTMQLAKPVKAMVRLPGHNPSVIPHTKHSALLCSAVREIGLGCVGMPQAMTKDGHFMVRSSRMKFGEYLLSSPLIWTGLRPPKTFDAVVKEVDIDYAEETEVTVDGEMRKTKRDFITCGPGVPFIIP